MDKNNTNTNTENCGNPICRHPESHHEPKCYGLSKITRDYCPCKSFVAPPAASTEDERHSIRCAGYQGSDTPINETMCDCRPASPPDERAREARKPPQQVAFEAIYKEHSFSYPDACKYDGCKEYHWGFYDGWEAASKHFAALESQAQEVEQTYDDCHSMRYLEKAEVVGNIHQHAELLDNSAD